MESIKADFGDGERTIYFKKRNLDQMDAVIKAEDVGKVEVLVVTLVTRCLNEQGGPMFTDSDKRKIRKEFDPGEVLRVVREIRLFDESVEKVGN
jgi:hypothetical protein